MTACVQPKRNQDTQEVKYDERFLIWTGQSVADCFVLSKLKSFKTKIENRDDLLQFKKTNQNTQEVKHERFLMSFVLSCPH